MRFLLMTLSVNEGIRMVEGGAGALDTLGVSVRLQPTWDASLTYDLLDGEPESGPQAVFVGRETLVGPLVNALAQPQQRGTYLISGYRGVGKTSLIIEAMRRARGELKKAKWDILPIVLNVSEVSASLSSASEFPAEVQLSIDARKLLTAMLRSLRNRLIREDSKALTALAKKVEYTYQKAEAKSFTQTQNQRAEAQLSINQER
jgi:hypothetical protein